MHDEPDPRDDWSPLPAERLALRPGEVTGSPRRAALKTERDEALFAALRERVAAAGPGESLIADLQRHDRRRKRRAATAEEGPERASALARDNGAASDGAFEVDADSEIDARELEPWFQSLPAREQGRLQAAWASERTRFSWAGTAARARLLRAAGQGAFVFVVNALILAVATHDPLRALLYAPVGAIAGVAAQLLGGQRFHFMAFGALGFGVLEGANLLTNPMMFYGMLLAVSTMALLGLDREMRMSAGERDV